MTHKTFRDVKPICLETLRNAQPKTGGATHEFIHGRTKTINP